MGSLTVRAAVATLVVAAGCLLAPGATSGAGAAPAAACTGSSGVTVVVDFGASGGGRQVRCVAGDPATGLDALGAAGFSYSFVPNKGPFVCAIDRKPDPCNGAPADAYWSYWTAARGGSWSYNDVGAHQRDPVPGSVEGWSFGAGSAPGVAPPAAPTTTAAPPPPTTAPRPPATQPPAPTEAPTATPAPRPAPTAAGTPDTSRPGTPSTGAAGDDPDGTSSTTAPSTTTTDRTAAAGDTDDTDDTDGDTADDGDGDGDEAAALDVDNTSSSRGPGAGALVALVAAGAIGGSAVWEVRRRRAPS